MAPDRPGPRAKRPGLVLLHRCQSRQRRGHDQHHIGDDRDQMRQNDARNRAGQPQPQEDPVQARRHRDGRHDDGCRKKQKDQTLAPEVDAAPAPARPGRRRAAAISVVARAMPVVSPRLSSTPDPGPSTLSMPSATSPAAAGRESASHGQRTRSPAGPAAGPATGPAAPRPAGAGGQRVIAAAFAAARAAHKAPAEPPRSAAISMEIA